MNGRRGFPVLARHSAGPPRLLLANYLLTEWMDTHLSFASSSTYLALRPLNRSDLFLCLYMAATIVHSHHRPQARTKCFIGKVLWELWMGLNVTFRKQLYQQAHFYLRFNNSFAILCYLSLEKKYINAKTEISLQFSNYSSLPFRGNHCYH